jgi:hypothetical protein
MAGIRIEGNTSANVVEVSSNNELKVIGPNTYNSIGNPSVNGGFSNNIFEADAGTITGSPLQRQGDISANYRQRVGIDTLIFNENFNGTGLNTSIWTGTSGSMTTAFSNGFFVLNSGNSTTANGYTRIQSYRGFPAYGSYPLQLEVEAMYVGSAIQPNTVTEIGFGFTSGTLAPTDGVFFRYNSAAELRCVISYNGNEIQSAAFTGAQIPSTNSRHHYIIVVGNDYAEFWIDNILYANLQIPAGNGMATLNQNLPVFIRTYNFSVSPSSAIQFKVANVSISIGDMNLQKPWREIQAGMQGHSSNGQTGMTMGSTALYANNTNPTAAVPTNTTAALGTGLGGNFWSTATLAVNTDGIISSYQVPAASATVPQKCLYITRIKIDTIVQTALAGGPFILQWGLAYGHTSVSLATIENSISKSPRRVPLGFQYFPASAAVGTQSLVIDHTLTVPICIQPGEFIQTIYKNIGTAGTAGTLAHTITFDGYWE